MAGKKGRSGRRPKREQFAALYEATERELHGILPEVAPALRELICGIYREEFTLDGEMRIYQTAPNVKAIELLLNRTMGETAKRIEIETFMRTEAERVAVATGLNPDDILAEATALLSRRG